MYTFNERGVLRKDGRILALPIAESYRLNMRVSLAVLLDYFAGENEPERRAFALHYQLGRRITVTAGWEMSESDLNAAVLDILLCGRTSAPFVLLHAERRDQFRQLALSEQVYGRVRAGAGNPGRRG